jgi:predicted small secreted protein
MNVSVMEIAQSIYIIYNKPSFSTSYLVARLNTSGRIKGSLVTVISDDKQSAYSYAIDAETGEKLVGMTYTMEIAKKEGLLSKKGSKWLTMPELMLRKRAQSSFINEFFPEVKFGMQTVEELEDTHIIETTVSSEDNGSADLNAIIASPKKSTKKRATKAKKEKEVVETVEATEQEEEKDLLADIEVEVAHEYVDADTGEVLPTKPDMSVLDGIGADGMRSEEVGQ